MLDDIDKVKAKSLDELFRYLLSGLTFFGALVISFKWDVCFLEHAKNVSATAIAIAILVMLTVGGLIYALHRAVPMFLVGRLFFGPHGERLRRLMSSLPNTSPERARLRILAQALVVPLLVIPAVFYIYCGMAVSGCGECGCCQKNNIVNLPQICLPFPATVVTFLIYVVGIQLCSLRGQWSLFENAIAVDVLRWRNQSDPRHIQHKMREWASQIHFMYCIGWSGFFALDLVAVSKLPFAS